MNYNKFIKGSLISYCAYSRHNKHFLIFLEEKNGDHIFYDVEANKIIEYNSMFVNKYNNVFFEEAK